MAGKPAASVWNPLDRVSCPHDTGDGCVTVSDLLTLLGGWGTADPDLDGDGIVGVPDLLTLLAAWGPC